MEGSTSYSRWIHVSERQVKMGFDEKKFICLVEDTKKKVVAFGTTSRSVLKSHKRYANLLYEFLKMTDQEFTQDLCLKWLNSQEHCTCSKDDYAYRNWVKFKRYIHLLSDEERGELNKWKVYRPNLIALPRTDNYLELIANYEKHLVESDYAESTVYNSLNAARSLLIHFEKCGILEEGQITNADVATYFATEHFRGRKPAGVQAEARKVKQFLCYLEDMDTVHSKLLHYAVPIYTVREEKIITIITTEVEKAILGDFPTYPANKREKSQYLLALHLGLRTCDIYNIKFTDINWTDGILTITQLKTGVEIRRRMDSETQNALIDYILKERRNCDSEYIFITAIGPAQRLKSGKRTCRCRIKNSSVLKDLPHDGLHILRRTYASRLLSCGITVNTIASMLGHINIKSVQCYLSTDEKNMKRCSLDLAIIPFGRGEF